MKISIGFSCRKIFLLSLCTVACGILILVSSLTTIYDNLHVPKFAVVIKNSSSVTTDIHLINNDAVPSPHLSKMQIVNPKLVYSVGDALQIKIVLFNSKNKRIITGGDLLRILLTNTQKNANVNGKVRDCGNGTYLGTLLLPWIGISEVIVSLDLPNEHKLMFDSARRQFGIIHLIFAVYKRSNISESTICGTVPKINGNGDTCNMTILTNGDPWYCVKPKTEGLFCNHWVESYTGKLVLPPSQERILKLHRFQKLSKGIKVDVKGDTLLMKRKTLPCNKISRDRTWNNGTTGFYFSNTWINIACKTTIKQTPEEYNKCLSGRHLIMIGDSNLRTMLQFFQEFLNLKITKGNPMKHSPGLIYGYNESNAVSISYISHGVPFYSPIYNRSLTIPASVTLDRLNVDKHNRSIIILYVWAHIIGIPYSVVEHKIRNLKEAVMRLFARAPHITVVIRGPHSFMDWTFSPLAYSDRVVLERLWHEEFKSLKFKVIYLNFWDITTGSASFDLHPAPLILKDMINIFMNHICDYN